MLPTDDVEDPTAPTASDSSDGFDSNCASSTFFFDGRGIAVSVEGVRFRAPDVSPKDPLSVKASGSSISLAFRFVVDSPVFVVGLRWEMADDGGRTGSVSMSLGSSLTVTS